MELNSGLSLLSHCPIFAAVAGAREVCLLLQLKLGSYLRALGLTLRLSRSIGLDYSLFGQSPFPIAYC